MLCPYREPLLTVSAMEDTKKNLLARLLELIARLRRECPWDRAQTIESLSPLLLDECYEAREAVSRGDFQALREELGDLLALVLMMGEIAGQDGKFDLEEVLETVVEKLERRHPHLFRGRKALSAEQVVELWGEMKAEEKDGSLLDGIPKSLPALRRACLIQQRASSVGFDWKNLEGILEKLAEEVEELKQARSKEEIEDELGDILFTLAHMGNNLGVDPEGALAKVCQKFQERWRGVEETLRRQGKDPKDATLEEMDAIWEKRKKENRA